MAPQVNVEVEAPVGGQPLYGLQREAYANIRGKDRKKFMEPWEHEKIVWQGEGEFEGYYIVDLDNQHDLAQDAKLQGHCGGAHGYWCFVKKTQHLLSLRDKDGVPHATIHCKPVDFVHTPQGNVEEARKWGKENGVVGYSGQVGETVYDGGATYTGRNYPQFMLDGRQCVILSVSGKGMWSTEGKAVTYKNAVMAFLEANKAKRNKPLPARPAPSYAAPRY